MIEDYKKTPSFYNNEAYFNKYLGCTSYYLSLQNVVTKIVDLINPSCVLELGSALGTTSIMLARKYDKIQFVGADIRDDVVKKANESAADYPNLDFITCDMCSYVASKDISEYDLIFLLYSFHHIVDPLENKVAFLNDCFKNMKSGSYMLITETFVPEDAVNIEQDQKISDLFKIRSEEGYASTFWAALESLTEDGIDLARSVAEVSHSEESKAGELVNRREDEYMVKFSWLVEMAKKIGFEIVISEPVNSIMEKAVLLKKI